MKILLITKIRSALYTYVNYFYAQNTSYLFAAQNVLVMYIHTLLNIINTCIVELTITRSLSLDSIALTAHVVYPTCYIHC